MNVTPLVDVVLVLLIVFMVVIPMMEKTPVEFPSIFNVDPERKGGSDPYTLSLTRNGQMYFEQERLDPDEFEAKLRAANERDKRKRLVLRADREANYGDVRLLFNKVQDIGFPGMSLRVNERTSGKD
jgi:biopolymer transport protein ExbD/biopolymer transport protein TolR